MTSQNILLQVDNDLNYLVHYNTKGSHWYQHDPNKRWQRDAAYAKGQPNPDAKTSVGDRVKNAATGVKNAVGNAYARAIAKNAADRNAKANDENLKALTKKTNTPADKLKKKMASLITDKMKSRAVGALDAGIKSATKSTALVDANAKLERLKQKEARKQAKEEKAISKEQSAKGKAYLEKGKDLTRNMSTEDLRKATERLKAENAYLEALSSRRSAEQKYKEALERPARENREKILKKIKDFRNDNFGIAIENAAMLGIKGAIEKSGNKEFADKLFRGTRIGDKKKK